MEASSDAKQVVLCDVEKAVDMKMLTQYLTITKAIDSIIKFTKSADRFLLYFRSQDDAEEFIRQRAFDNQIIKRKFNLYLSIFDQKEVQVETYIVNGLDTEKLRKCFQICCINGNCKFILKYEGEKKIAKAMVQFLKSKREEGKWKEMTSQLKEIEVTLGQTEQTMDEFMCSIQLVSFDHIQKIQINEEEKIRLDDSLKAFMLKVSEKQLTNFEVKTFLHQENAPMVKAYLRYSTADDTFEVFEKLRLYLLDLPQIQCRLFYYSKQANSFRTLFTKGLQMPENISLKHFQNQLIEDFRKITPGVVQILLKECPGRIWTGKIYLRDEASGKILASEYVQRRSLIYMHYKDKSKITINLFQDKQAMNQIRKYQDNAERMLDHIRITQQRQKLIAPMVMNQQYMPKQAPFRKPQRYREREESKPQAADKKEVKIKYKPKEEEFPSL